MFKDAISSGNEWSTFPGRTSKDLHSQRIMGEACQTQQLYHRWPYTIVKNDRSPPPFSPTPTAYVAEESIVWDEVFGLETWTRSDRTHNCGGTRSEFRASDELKNVHWTSDTTYGRGRRLQYILMFARCRCMLYTWKVVSVHAGIVTVHRGPESMADGSINCDFSCHLTCAG